MVCYAFKKKKRFYTYQKEKGRMFKFTKQSLVSLDQELTSSLTPRRLRIMRAGQCQLSARGASQAAGGQPTADRILLFLWIPKYLEKQYFFPFKLGFAAVVLRTVMQQVMFMKLLLESLLPTQSYLTCSRYSILVSKIIPLWRHQDVR